MIDIWELPDEILSHILGYVPGVTLLRCRSVCSRWYQVISDIIKKPVTWKEKCFADIPEDVLLDLTMATSLENLAKGCPVCGVCLSDGTVLEGTSCGRVHSEKRINPCSIDETGSAWLIIYMIWWRSKKVGNVQALRVNLVTQSTLTRVKINGDYMIGASKIGTVEFYDHLAGGGCRSSFLANYYNIVDLKLIPLQAYGINSIPREDLGNMWTTKLVTGGNDRSMNVFSISSSTLDYHLDYRESSSTRIVGVGVWGNMLIGTSAEVLYAGHKVMNLSTERVEAYLKGFRAYPQCMDVWKNKVLSGTTQGHLLRWKLDDCIGSDNNGDTVMMLEAEQVADLNDMIVDCIYRDPVILCIKAPGVLCISIDDGRTFKQINTMAILKGTAKLMALKGNIFALCTSAGVVYVYYIKDYKDFDKLDLSACRTCIHTRAETVYNMDIGDDGDGPMMAMALNDAQVLLVRWVDMNS